ncbi:putative RNA methyltransferase [Sesamum angolense]|uniref:RNA methyltransferase n=1 Tax=Sesamum angolense TaxID=2727404 RepID=A0AAE1WPM6_9LAMI|nr:putative RNA methyltransferase [Sesamum angolense]
MGEKNTKDRSNGNRDERKGKKNNNEKKTERSEELAVCTAQEQSSKKKNRKEVAIFGNYRNYYGYRVGQDLDEDPRLKQRSLVAGAFLVLTSMEFLIDFDVLVKRVVARIEDAYWTLRKVIRTSKHRVTSDGASISGFVNNASESLMEEKQNSSGDSPFQLENDLLEIVSFQKGNFVQNWRPPENTSYHAILWGDDGLITLFWRVWMLLQPTAAANYKNIQIPPEDFQDVLLDKIGFRR